MKIDEMERELQVQSTRRVTPKRSLRKAPAGAARPPPRVRAHGKVLPFFSVLLRGKDPDAGVGHPSVGYAQGIFVVIAFGWLVESVSFGYLGWTLSVAAEPEWLRWPLSIGLGLAISTTLVFLALLFVRKPLPRPKLTLAWKIAVPSALGLFGLWLAWKFGLDLGSSLMIGIASAGLFTLAGFMFGWIESAFIISRVIVLGMAAIVVTIPLHEMMFKKEIDRAYFQARAEETQEKIDELSAGIETKCKEEAKFEEIQESGASAVCENEAKELAVAELNLEAIEHMRESSFGRRDSQQNSKNQKRRRALLEEAQKQRAEEAVRILQQNPRFYRGKRGRELATNKIASLSQQKDYEQGLFNACEKQTQNVKEEVNVCVDRAKDQPEFKGQFEDLERRLEAYDAGQGEIGALELGLALEDVKRGGGKPEEGEEALARRYVVLQKFLTPWFLALLVPLIVITLKLTAGRELEDYLHARWGKPIS